nr:hypothetical protein [Tanacetum cinerariifolium]
MTSFGYRLNPRYAIKECLSCGALFTGNFCCSKGSLEDKVLVPKLPENCARCAKCGHPVNGPYCQGCALLRERFEEDLDHGVNPPHIDKCCCECGKALDGIYCQRCICFDPTCYSKKENSAPCISKPNFVDESSNIINPPSQPPIYSCEFYGSNAQYGHYCTLQALFNNLEQDYSQDFNFLQYIHNFQQ